MHGGRLLLLIMALAFSDAALALRCGNKLVQRGDPMPKVLKICGEPVATQQRSICLLYTSDAADDFAVV